MTQLFVTLEQMNISINRCLMQGIGKYRPTFEKGDVELLIELAYAPSLTVQHDIVLSKRQTQFMAHPHVEQLVLWIGRTVINDLAAVNKTSVADVTTNVESYSGIKDGPVSPFARYEYGLYFISIAGSTILELISPSLKK